LKDLYIFVNKNMRESEIKFYQSDDGITKIDVKFDHDTVWLSQKQMAQLYDKDSDTIGLHIRNIYLSKELVEKSTTEFFSVVQIEGKRQVKRKIKLYNLDTIISVGYRVNSKRGIHFRIWATSLIKDVYALDILDQYDYQKLEINNTSGKEIYQLTYKEAIEQIHLVKRIYGNS